MNVEQAFDFFKVRATQLGTRTRVVVARLFGVGQDGDTDEQQEPIEEAECLSPIGFKSRPKVSSTTEAFGVRLGDEVVVLCVIDKGGTKLTDAELAEGEVLLYGPTEPTATVRITKDGDVVITAKAGRNVVLKAPDGGEVRLNEDGTGYAGKEVARKDDGVSAAGTPLSPGTMAHWMAQVTAACNAVAPGSVPTPPSTVGQIVDGAEKVKA